MTVRRVARPGVLRQISLDRHTVIEASAGTGKTYTLESLVVAIVLGTDVTLDRLLVVTFTEKATHEIRTRVRAKIEGLLAGEGSEPTEAELRAGDYFTLDDAARVKLEAALHAFDAATIATIHAFCHRVLRENAFASGRCFEEQQVDGREAFGRALREALRRDVAPDPERARWLEAALRTGWSMERLEKLLWGCATARAVLVPAFDAAALDAALVAFPLDDARDLRLGGMMKAWGVHARTAGSVAGQLNELADFVEAAQVIEGSAGGRDAPRFVNDAKAVLGKLRDKLPAVVPPAGASDAATRVRLAALELAAATPPFPAVLAHTLLPSVTAELERSKRAAGRYDFDDMLSLVDDALRGPRGGALAAAMRQRWRYALIDEFQDTDETQWSIFRRAFFDGGAGDGPRSTLVLVGDPKQSIYRFRGADVETYLGACAEVEHAGGARVVLDRNYRSTPAIVEACDRLFAPGTPDAFFTGAIAYAPVGAGRPDRTLVDGAGVPVTPLSAPGFRDELALPALGAFIAREVRAATDPDRPWRLDGRPLDPGDAFVLTRTLREGHVIGEALRAAGVPHAFFKEEGLFQSDEAKDLRVLLAAIDHPEDRALRIKAWLTPFFGLPLVAIERTRDLGPSHPLHARLDAWKALADARAFDRLFESIVADSAIVRRAIFFADGEREITNTMHLVEFLVERARASQVTLRDLVQELSGLCARTRLTLDIEGNMQRLEGERPAVQIMTIHKAKGLEAPLVFVAGGLRSSPTDDVRVYHDSGQRIAWVGSLSSEVEPLVKQEDREEEQRLMYVALTRAMGRLYLPYVVDGKGDAVTLRGAYDRVNRRVAQLVRAADPLVATEEVAGAPSCLAQAPAHAHTLANGWTPPQRLLRVPDEGAVYASLRERHRAAIVTSYTRMAHAGQGSQAGPGRQAGQGGTRAPTGPRSSMADAAEQRRAEKSAETFDQPGVAAAITLRSARTSGVFLHELLERVPLATFAASGAGASSEFAAWRARTDVATLFDEALAAHSIDAAQREHAERLVWGAYTQAVTLPSGLAGGPGVAGGERLAGFAHATRIVREMEFVYPIPQQDHPPLGEVSARPLAIDHGYLRGSLDLAFEHRGLTYFVDWKSDSLASFAPASLAAHVASHYEDQVKLYALAVVRLLGVRSRADHEARFGGLLYCFLRGFEGEAGIWSARPSWETLTSWDASLRLRRDWGGGRAAWTD